ncbi:phosphatidate cytidylyltransferase [Petrachloros mirabilis]
MIECRSTNQEPVQTVSPVRARFDSRRIYTVLALVPLLYGAVRYLPPLAFTSLVALAGLMTLYELYRLCLPSSPDRLLSGIGFFGCLALIMQPHYPDLLLPSMLIALCAILSVPLFTKMPLHDVFKGNAIALTGMLYIGLPLSFLVAIRMLPEGEWLIFFLLAITWAGDTGAYFAGTLLGQHPLAPKISPKKTVEGLVGGLLAAMILAYAARWWFLPDFSTVDCAVLAVLLTMTGLWGDLAESAIKRSVGAKDSGSVLPGHGGMLDRLDSLLFAGPAFYYYITTFSRIGTS